MAALLTALLIAPLTAPLVEPLIAPLTEPPTTPPTTPGFPSPLRYLHGFGPSPRARSDFDDPTPYLLKRLKPCD